MTATPTVVLTPIIAIESVTPAHSGPNIKRILEEVEMELDSDSSVGKEDARPEPATSKIGAVDAVAPVARSVRPVVSEACDEVPADAGSQAPSLDGVWALTAPDA